MHLYTKTAAARAGRLFWSCRAASCRSPYAGVSRVRFQGILSTLILRVPLAAHNKDTRAGLNRKLCEVAATACVAEGARAYWVAKMKV